MLKRRMAIPLMLFCGLMLLGGCSQKVETTTPSENNASRDYQVINELTLQPPPTYVGFENATHGITVGYAGAVTYSKDGGKTWLEGKNKSACRFGLDIINENKAIHCGNAGNICVTQDGGETWEAVTDFGDGEPKQCRYLSFLDENTGWIASINRLACTQDGGLTWSELSLPEGIDEIAAMYLRTSQEGYLFDAVGGFFKTLDGGKSWSKEKKLLESLDVTSRKLFIIESPIAQIHFTDADHGMIVFNAFCSKGGKIKLLETEDGGKTWQDKDISLGDDYKMIKLYLTRDGQYMTVQNMFGKVKLLELQ